MRRWANLIALTLLFGIAAPAHADDALADFVVLGADPDDFRPVSEAASAGGLFFVGGETRATDPRADAALVALAEGDGREVWRAVEGLPDVSETFSVVGSAGGRVCTAGSVVNPVSPVFARELLVACYGTQRGERLWLRRVALDPARFQTIVGPLLHVSERAVVVTIASLSFFARENLVLRFDAKDGSGG